MSDMFCIIATDYSAVATGYLTIPTYYSHVAIDDVTINMWSAAQTIHFSQQMSDLFCIIAIDYSFITIGYLTVPTDHSYVAIICDLLHRPFICLKKRVIYFVLL